MNCQLIETCSTSSGGYHIRSAKWVGIVYALFAFAISLFCSTPVFAQFESAALNGTIRDQSGAVIPGATISARNVDTGLVKATTSNADGIYNIIQIPPGNYVVTATAAGFSTIEHKGIALSVAQTLTENFELKPGGANATVSVTGNTGAELETSDTQISTTLDTQMVNDLPTLGRNYTQLFILNPGTSPVLGDGQTGTRTVNAGPAIYPEVGGSTPRSNIYRLDGISNNEAIGGDEIITPIPDDIQQVKIVNHNDNAMFGQGLGGTINVITKSGTNQLHGAAWEFWRNPQFGDALPGPNLGTPGTAGYVAPILSTAHQNQYGFSVGGPVRIPWLYDGHNKSFWYFSWEGFRYTDANLAYDILPSDAMYNGDFSSLLSQQNSDGSTGVVIYNPYTGQPFPNNQIPSNLIDKNMVALLKGVAPAGPNGNYGGGYNYRYQAPTIQRSNQFDVRGDEYLTRKDQVWGHILWANQVHGTQGWNANYLEGNGFKGKNIGIQWIHTFSPASVLTVSFGHNDGIQDPDGATYFGSNADDLAAPFKSYACGFTNSIRGSGCLLPSVALGSYLLGYPGESNQAPTGLSHIWEYKADYMQQFRRHTFYVGFDLSTNNQGAAVVQAADLGYSNWETSQRVNNNPADGPAGTPYTGDPLASALLSLPDWYYRYDTNHTESGGWVNGIYGMDSWKVRDNLTLNLGLRWDVSILPVMHSPYGDFFDLYDFDNGTDILENMPKFCGTAPNYSVAAGTECIPGNSLPDHVVVASNPGHLYKNGWTDFQPRFGLAWSVNPRMVWHLAFGRTYDNWAAIEQTAGNTQSWLLNQGTYNSEINDFPTEGQTTNTSENPGNTYWDWPPPATPWGLGGYSSRPQVSNPYSDQWTFGFEQSINPLNKLSVHYVGSRGRHLDYMYQGGTALTPSPTATLDPEWGTLYPNIDRAPFPYMGRAFYDIPIGKMNYNGLQVQFNGRLRSAGLSYIASYTWSKTLNMGSDSWYGAGLMVEDPYHPEKDYGPASFDLPQVFSTGWTWDVPVGRNHFSTGSRIVDYIIGNWQLNGIFSARSGTPFSIFTPGDIANTGNSSGYSEPGGAYERINIKPGMNVRVRHQTYAAGFNTAAIEAPPTGTFGTSGRNAFRTSPYWNVDNSLFREFPFWESMKLQLRLDAFNSLNHETLGQPDNCFNCDATFGQIRTWASTPRELQLSGKVVF